MLKNHWFMKFARTTKFHTQIYLVSVIHHGKIAQILVGVQLDTKYSIKED